MRRSLKWYLRRHPLLYKVRFKLVSRYSSPERLMAYTYNDENHKADIPAIYSSINEKIFSDASAKLSSLDKAKHLAVWLRNNIKGGRGLGTSSDKALEMMLNGEGGVCSDLSQVFNNFCVINDIKVKEWGLTKVPYDPRFGGHTFNEVYSEEHGKWVLIDISKSVVFCDAENRLLSVLELFQMKDAGADVRYESFNAHFKLDHTNIRSNYFIPEAMPFLITNYSNKLYDRFLRRFQAFPVSVVHYFVVLRGRQYYFEFPQIPKR